MRIGIITRRLDRLAGVERHAFHLALELEKRGHQVMLYTFYFEKRETFFENSSLRVIALNPVPTFFSKTLEKLPFIGRVLQHEREVREARSLALLIHPDTEILNPHDQAVYRVAAYYKKFVKNIPSVWSMHDMPTRTFSRMRNQECDGVSRNVLLRALDRIIDWVEYLRFIKLQDVVTVLDERDRRWVKEYFRKEAIVTRSGVDAAGLEFMKRSRIQLPIKLLMIGIFFPHRRFEDTLEAMTILRERGIQTTLTLIGSHRKTNPYFHTIERIIREHSLKAFVRLEGRVSEAELKSGLKKADIFLFPNHLQSWGLVVFEALASGIPTIVSETAGASEVLRNRHTALIVPPKNPEAIASAIETLYTNPELYESLSVNGRALTETDISWSKLGDVMERVFKSALWGT